MNFLSEQVRWIGQEAANCDMLVPAGTDLIGKPFDPAIAEQQVCQLKPEFLEVAAFSSDDIQQNRVYYVKLKDKSRYSEMYDPEVKGLMYPMFF